MKTKIQTYKDSIDYYYTHLEDDNEYQIVDPNLNDGDPISVHQNLLVTEEDDLVVDIIPYSNGLQQKIIVNKKAVERFHPKNINNNLFWRYSRTRFPLFSVCGSPTRSIEECNKVTLLASKQEGLFTFLDNMINNSKEKLNVLEIGYGHGNVFQEINNRTNYIGIDFLKDPEFKDYDNLLEIKKSGIPRKIKNNSLDVVYSVNVLQHCSQKDRFDYLKQGYDKLKPGGVFIGSCLIVTPTNKNDLVWGIEDSVGRKYCNFFKQLTEVDTIDELEYMVEVLGYKILESKIRSIQHLGFILKK